VGRVVIPANTFALGDIIEIEQRCWKIPSNAGTTINVYTNTTLAVAGAVLLATFAGATNAGLRPIRRVGVVQSVGGLTEFASTGLTTLANDLTSQNSAGPITVVTVDWTVEQNIFVTIQNSSASDFTTNSMLIVKKW